MVKRIFKASLLLLVFLLVGCNNAPPTEKTSTGEEIKKDEYFFSGGDMFCAKGITNSLVNNKTFEYVLNENNYMLVSMYGAYGYEDCSIVTKTNPQKLEEISEKVQKYIQGERLYCFTKSDKSFVDKSTFDFYRGLTGVNYFLNNEVGFKESDCRVIHKKLPERKKQKVEVVPPLNSVDTPSSESSTITEKPGNLDVTKITGG